MGASTPLFASRDCSHLDPRVGLYEKRELEAMPEFHDSPYEPTEGQTLRLRWQETLCFVQLDRPESKNTINARLIRDCAQVFRECEERATVVVLEGTKAHFCMGADLDSLPDVDSPAPDPEPLYRLWLQLAQGSFVSVAHVEGQANAGGVGFVAACDLVFASPGASFSLSELLFGLMPACVLPFLIRKVGFQRAHAMTLMTAPVTAQQGHEWGLVDRCQDPSRALLRRSLSRLSCLNKDAIRRYKRYMATLDDSLESSMLEALAANREVFNDRTNRERISRYVQTGQFPWK